MSRIRCLVCVKVSLLTDRVRNECHGRQTNEHTCRVVMGASETTSATTDGDDSSGGAATDGDQKGSRAS